MTIRIACTMLLAAAGTASAMGAEYAIVELPVVAGPAWNAPPGSGATTIGGDGRVYGMSVAGPMGEFLHPAAWDGAATALPLPPATLHGRVNAVDAAGAAVGVAWNLGDVQTTAVRWDNGSMTVLGAFEALGIADDGSVVGARRTLGADLVTDAVRWSGGMLSVLPDLGGSYAAAAACAANGDAVGWATTGEPEHPRPILWRNGLVIDLGTLGGASGRAHALDGAGRIVGTAQRADGRWRPVRWTVDAIGTVTERVDLGTLGLEEGTALAIDADGTIVGTSGGRAFRWRDDVLADLNDLVPPGDWLLVSATGIENGRIVGCGRRLGLERGFVLGTFVLGDLDGDGSVGFLDLLALLSAWGPCTPSCPADLDGDGMVGFSDLTILLSNWG